MVGRTAELRLELEDDGHGLLEDHEFGLRALRVQVDSAQAAELLERLVDVAHAHPAFTKFVYFTII